MTTLFGMGYKPQIESGEYSVICNGRPIEIVKWDCKGLCPILGVQENADGEQEALFFKENGCTLNEKLWLYVEIPNNYTKFEQAIEKLICEIDSDCACYIHNVDKYIKEFAPIIMKAAEDEIREKTNGNYAWLVGKEEAYKNMPKWRLVKLGEDYPTCITREADVNGDWTYRLSVGKLYDGCQYIPLKELGQLSIEEG